MGASTFVAEKAKTELPGGLQDRGLFWFCAYRAGNERSVFPNTPRVVGLCLAAVGEGEFELCR